MSLHGMLLALWLNRSRLAVGVRTCILVQPVLWAHHLCRPRSSRYVASSSSSCAYHASRANLALTLATTRHDKLLLVHETTAKAVQHTLQCCNAGAPADLVQIVTGYGDAGNALVTGGVDKLIFVGSTKAGSCAFALCSM